MGSIAGQPPTRSHAPPAMPAVNSPLAISQKAFTQESCRSVKSIFINGPRAQRCMTVNRSFRPLRVAALHYFRDHGARRSPRCRPPGLCVLVALPFSCSTSARPLSTGFGLNRSRDTSRTLPCASFSGRPSTSKRTATPFFTPWFILRIGFRPAGEGAIPAAPPSP